MSTFTVGAALLDAMVLSVLEKEDTYGYQITKDIQSQLDISESTLYPVLRRLQKDGNLSTYDRPYQGRNRRYYQITLLGKNHLVQYRKDWAEYKKQVDAFLGDNSADKKPQNEDEGKTIIADNT